MTDETISGETVIDAVENLTKIMNGEIDGKSEAVEEAKAKGLNQHQRAVAAKYAGEGEITVDDSTTPNFGEKLAAGVELPWTFVIDGVQFVKKTSTGAGNNPSEWWWTEEGFRFYYYKYDDRENKVAIREIDSGG